MQIDEKIINLFPTPVYKYNIKRDFEKQELEFFQKIETKINYGNVSSVEQYVLNNDILKDLKEELEKRLKEYFLTVYKPSDVEIYITQSWLNYSEAGQHHHKHCHPNSILSGVLYIEAAEETDKIFFYKREYQQISIKPTEFNIWNSDSWWLPVGTGDLVLFPSSMDHMVESVEKNNNRNKRISLAFNTFVKGTMGSYGASSELKL